MAPQRPVLIVGGGVAGLSAALACAPQPVLLLSRGRDGAGSASVLAQGGIAAALDPADATAAHARDTIAAGAGHNDVAMVRQLVSAAPAAIAWLQSQGVVFDPHGDGLDLGREGGHGVARIVHAGGDRTGARVMEALLAQVQRASHIDWRDDVDVDALLLRDGRVAGVQANDPAGRSEVIEAGAVVLATGGLGALFAHTTNPGGSAGGGLALAIAAGARPRDLEFVQFHPTALATGGPTLPLITEALRGAGARLRDDHGRPLMTGLHALGDLAPRDVVARRVWQVQREGPVWLDATALPAGWHDDFPTVMAVCLAHGVDPRTAPIPVTPAAHFHMGGIATDVDGRTSLPGLYAVGEVACNGVHGANRLASNALLEGVVFGRRVGSQLARRRHAPLRHCGSFDLVDRGAGLATDQFAMLRETMWRAAGPVRSATTMAHAIAELGPLAAMGWQAGLARALLAAALRRPHNLGAHWRDDAYVATKAHRRASVVGLPPQV